MTVKLGCKAKLLAPIQRSVGAPFPREAFGRIVGTHRVQGMNDIYASCVPTFYLNALTDAAARDGKKLALPDQMAADLLEEFDPTMLDGMDPEDMLKWGESHAIEGYQLDWWKRIDVEEEEEIRTHIEIEGAVGLVINLAEGQQYSSVWRSSNGIPGSLGEHMVCLDEFSGGFSSGTSWGRYIEAERGIFAPEWSLAIYAVKFKEAK